MRLPYQMFGRPGSSPVTQAVAQARQAVSRAGSPEEAVRRLMASNPQFRQAVGNRSPEQAVREAAAGSGIDINGLIGMIGGTNGR